MSICQSKAADVDQLDAAMTVCRASKALVHWWYAPDSYDAYINADTAPEVAEPDRRVKGT